ncbi:MAG: DUF1553 domain-containing protein [Planctomycetaceae bacterium]|nr:DUF1553 domain-containing protein [Planctomycetaceae bacterium]
MRRSLISLLIIAMGSVAVAAPPLDDATFFRTQIRPILSDKCFKCHGPAVQEADLRLDEAGAAIDLGSIVAGEPDESELLRRVLSDDESERMPPVDTGKTLTTQETAALREWIERGAPYADHWAYERDRNVSPPLPSSPARCGNGIDAFVLQRLEAIGLELAEPAERATLIRRVTLDLTGLLPSVDEVEAFVADERPDAYDRLVDRLLASPHHGERQARHWLDLARYADSNGFTIDGARSIWPYRDWVIKSLNANKPFDEFTIEQLAGDLLPEASLDQLVATGFQRNTPLNEEGGTDPEQFRVERTVDRTNTIGAVWLGLTVGCAQCHDHKFDAISQREYYQLYAFFNSADEANLRLPSPDEQRKLDELRETLERLKQEQSQTSDVRRAELDQLIATIPHEATREWKAVAPRAISTEQSSMLSALDDASILASGDVPTTDVYHVAATLPAGKVTSVRLEALTHPSLPKGGPGRAGNGNFVLSRFDLKIGGRVVPLRRAVADHSQDDYHVSLALTGDRSKGWAISTTSGNQNVDRTAVFVLAEPVDLTVATDAEFVLAFATQPSYYSLGRFRLSTGDFDSRIASLPIALQRRVASGAALAESELLAVLNEAETERVKETEAAIKRIENDLDSTLILRQRPEPRVSHIHKRGDFLNLGDEVQPGTLAALPPLEPAGEFATRLDLARWLVRDDQPLTPRVVVNRIWQQYFGYGLVETENDLGMQGSFPTHPQLLDWLAEEFVSSGWDLKHIHRLIVTSETYRQSSAWRDDTFVKDARNKLLARQNRLRLDAEILRDAALSASDLFCDDIGGPGVFPPQPDEVFSFTQSQRKWTADVNGDRYRRGMYTHIWRQSQHPLLTTFDGADAQTSCTRRNRSNTPLQALHLANDEAFIELAEGLAERVLAADMATDVDRVELAFRTCLGRAPSSEEREALLAMLHDQQTKHPDTAWLMLARTLLNVDEFVTRE